MAATVHAAVLFAGSQAAGTTTEEDSREAIDLLRRYLAASEQRVQILDTAVPSSPRDAESHLAEGRNGQGSGGEDDRNEGTEGKARAGDLSPAANGMGGNGKGRGVAPRPPAKVPLGKLPPEVIQRVVRQNFGRFRLCFEAAANPSWFFNRRVTVRFVIDRTGAVSSSTVVHSDLPDRTVPICVAQAFKTLEFPRPEGGVVVVSYPIMLPLGG